jgi:hypothetical protein
MIRQILPLMSSRGASGGRADERIRLHRVGREGGVEASRDFVVSVALDVIGKREGIEPASRKLEPLREQLARAKDAIGY